MFNRGGTCHNCDMTLDHFEGIIRAFQERAPFRPFLVDMVNGSRIEVDHPEAMVLRGGAAVYISSAGVPTLFDHDSVAQVTDVADQRAA